jgi:hypothetical protein
MAAAYGARAVNPEMLVADAATSLAPLKYPYGSNINLAMPALSWALQLKHGDSQTDPLVIHQPALSHHSCRALAASLSLLLASAAIDKRDPVRVERLQLPAHRLSVVGANEHPKKRRMAALISLLSRICRVPHFAALLAILCVSPPTFIKRASIKV